MLPHTPGSRLTLLHERSGSLADFLERRLQNAKFLRAQFREHFSHLSGMLSERRRNELLSIRGEGNDPNAPVFGALDAADKASGEESIDSDTD